MEEKILKAYGRLASYVAQKSVSDLLPLKESDAQAIDEVLKSLDGKYIYSDAIRIRFCLDGKGGEVEDVMKYLGVNYAVAYGRIKSAQRKLSRLEGRRFNVFNNLFRSTLEEITKGVRYLLLSIRIMI